MASPQAAALQLLQDFQQVCCLQAAGRLCVVGHSDFNSINTPLLSRLHGSLSNATAVLTLLLPSCYTCPTTNAYAPLI
jgi:hypothetical protein